MKSRILFAAVAVGLAQQASATLIDEGLNTLDTATGLEWLDLTQSAGKTFADVSSRFGSNGAYAGYRYATAAETQAIFLQFGLPLVVPTDYRGLAAVSPAAGVKAFQALFGSAASSFFAGLVSDTVPGDPSSHQLFFGAGSPANVDPKLASATLITAFPTDPSTYHDNVYQDTYTIALGATEQPHGYSNGSFLVRQVGGSIAAVPEAGTWALVLLGLGAVGFATRRRAG